MRNDQGTIRKALSGFYYVQTDDGLVTCRARGKFRYQKITPLVGDRVAITVQDDGSGSLDHILPRRNAFQRPAVANLDQLVIIASGAIPVSDPFLLDRIISLVFFIGPGLGGAAGLMVGIYYGQIDFTMGWSYGLKAFTAAILGGIGNIPGAMIGGLLLGVIEALAAGYIAIAWKDAIAFTVLILILIIRPTGILGERTADKL